MAINDLINKIILEDQFSKAFDQYENRLTAVDSKTNKFKNGLGGLAVGFGVVVGGLAAAAVALDELTGAAVENQKAMFNVGAAAAAANSEFGDSVGTVESWTNSVKATGDQLRVFGDQDVANATARLIDMTKRLGFTEEQMRVMLARTGDLSAGKTDLVGGIERVTAAMRGEAESAEFLGLSLNETAIRAYAEAHGLVWKELSDADKAQARYQLFLEQTNAMQGRAAESAKTLAGQEAELARLRERQIAELGRGLLPLKEGELFWYKKITEAQVPLGNAIQGAFAVAVGSAKTFGVVLEKLVAFLFEVGNGVKAINQAVQNGDFSGLESAFDGAKQRGGELRATITDLGAIWREQNRQTYEGWQQNEQAALDMATATTQAGAAQTEFATAGQAAASTIAEAYGKLAEDREKLAGQINKRIEAAEFDHAQRIIRINQDIARATAEAAGQAAAARTASDQKYTEDSIALERNLAQEKAQAEAEANAQIARLNQDSAAARRKTAGEIRQVNQDLKQALRSLEKDTGQEIAGINSDLADDLADKQAKAAQDKLEIIRDAGEKAVALEKQVADKRKSVNDQFESEFADADPFKRKILEFNRQEELRLLDQQEADEKVALDTQTQQAVKAVEDRVTAEAAILEREAQQKRERATQEAAERAEVLKREAAERKAALEERLKDELEANARRQEEIRADLAAEQSKRDTAAAEARAKLQQKHAEELVAIDQQEADKAARAQEALARENQNHADRLAQLRFSNQQELSELQDKLTEVEREEAASYLRRLQEARTFAADRRAIEGYGSGGQGGAGGGTGAGTTTTNSVVVNNYGTPGGYAGASQTGRNVRDALNGF